MTKQTIIVFGARGGLGYEIVAAAQRAGWMVTAVIRPDSDASDLCKLGCEVAFADACDPDAVAEAMQKVSHSASVISALGSRDGLADDIGNCTVADAAEACGLNRMLLISSLGAGDSRVHASPRLLEAIGGILEAKTRAEDHLKTSRLPYVIIRPGGLVNGEASGGGVLAKAMDVHGFIARGELASLVLDCLRRDDCRNTILSAIDPDCHPPPRV